MSTLVSIISFIVVLGGLVLFHEFGHFLAAKLCGVFVEEFAIGMGPRLFSFKKGETTYSINLFPIGGYVKMLGEEESSDNPRSFNKQPIRERIFIVTAGVIMNILVAGVAYFIFLAINSFSLIIPIMGEYQFKFAETQNVVVVDFVAENSPASEAGLKPGEVIIAVDNNPTTSMEELGDYILERKGIEVILTVVDFYGNGEHVVTLVPRVNPPEGEGAIGIAMAEAMKISYTGVNKVFSGFGHSYNMIGYTLVILKDLIKSTIVTGDISYVSETVSGPVGVFVVTDMVVRAAGIVGLLDIVGLMSSSLAFMNLLPFPALDGGHVVLLLLEKARGKRLNPKIESWLTATGFFVLMGFMLLISIKDFFQYGIFDWLIFWK